MRLLNAHTLEFAEFVGDDLPEYAILSHTWVDGQEVTFQEMEKLEAPTRSKSGFKKILHTAELTIAHNLTYFWIDTCCIDKKSSAELSEAINSMYAWYQKSEVCFAHLSDLISPENLIGEIEGELRLDQNIEEAYHELKGCRWFTRGWTLQELLAPRNLLFYTAEWDFYARKDHGFAHVLSRVTGISLDVLQKHRRYHRCSVAERFSWASKRSTKRVEDIAYCLLGLFDINMPLLYGEGSKAFTRLQEEILKREADHTLFLWHDPKTTAGCYRGLLASHPKCFEISGKIQVKRPKDGLEAIEECTFTVRGLRMTLPLLPIKLFKKEDIRWCSVQKPEVMDTERADQNLVIPYFRCEDRHGRKGEYVSILLKRFHPHQRQYVRVLPFLTVRVKNSAIPKFNSAYTGGRLQPEIMYVRSSPENFGPKFGVRLYGMRFPATVWRSDQFKIAGPPTKEDRLILCKHDQGQRSEAHMIIEQESDDRSRRQFWDFFVRYEEMVGIKEEYLLTGYAHARKNADEPISTGVKNTSLPHARLKLSMARMEVEDGFCIATLRFWGFRSFETTKTAHLERLSEGEGSHHSMERSLSDLSLSLSMTTSAQMDDSIIEETEEEGSTQMIEPTLAGAEQGRP